LEGKNISRLGRDRMKIRDRDKMILKFKARKSRGRKKK
jgi:hypothetical protein